MPKIPRLTAHQAETLVLRAGFKFARQSGSHKIYINGKIRITIPIHSTRVLHPKIIKSIFDDIKKAENL